MARREPAEGAGTMGDRAWTTDAAGLRVLSGPSADETAECRSLLNVSAGLSCEETQIRIAVLQRRHAAALKAAAALGSGAADAARPA
jgi:hypothetical protein